MPRITINSTIETPHVCVFYDFDGRSEVFAAWLKPNAYNSWRMGTFANIARAMFAMDGSVATHPNMKAVAFSNAGDAAAFRQRWLAELEGVWKGTIVFLKGPVLEPSPELAFQFAFPSNRIAEVETWAVENLEGRWKVLRNPYNASIGIETLPDAMTCRLKFDFLKVISLPMETAA